MQKLSSAEIEIGLKRLRGWTLETNKIRKQFKFKDFATAIEFMNRLVPLAEELDHHPDWSNSYNKVTISLTSHEIGGLSEKDFIFAKAADKVSNNLDK